jgi:hypothetical protein
LVSHQRFSAFICGPFFGFLCVLCVLCGEKAQIQKIPIGAAEGTGGVLG